MIVVVSGWRGWLNAAFVHTQMEIIDDMFGLYSVDLRVGCCPTGVDRFVREWAVANRPRLRSFTVYNADWGNLGKAAGPIRNGQMLRGENNLKDPNPGVASDLLLAFPQPGVKWKSPGSGTVGCMLDAFALGIDVHVPGYKGPA